ncbi:MAG: tRNA (guanosine(37)-N1)-methyltransferase TrmD [Clostridia bacterium]
MRFDVMTLFPELIEEALNKSITGRAIKKGAFVLKCHNIRDYSTDKHRKVDDTPYGGGCGMLMTPQPIDDCFSAIKNELALKPHCIYMSPKGKVLTQNKAKELLSYENITILCGHYEGVDQRILDMIVDEEISIGDYITTGGELPTMVLIDVVARMLDGVLSKNECFEDESHYEGMLEYPQYTRPANYKGRLVPEVLQNGDHAKISAYKKEQALAITQKNRPDLLNKDE